MVHFNNCLLTNRESFQRTVPETMAEEGESPDHDSYLQIHHSTFNSVVEELYKSIEHKVPIAQLQDSYGGEEIPKEEQDQISQLLAHKLHVPQLLAMQEVQMETLEIAECQH